MLFRALFFPLAVFAFAAGAERDVRAEMKAAGKAATTWRAALGGEVVAVHWPEGEGPIVYAVATAPGKTRLFRLDPQTGKSVPGAVGDIVSREVAPVSPGVVAHGPFDNGPATSLTVENARNEPIGLFWISGNGKRHSYGTLAPGKRRAMDTYAGHHWLFCDPAGKPLAGSIATASPGRVRVAGVVADAPETDPALSPDGCWRASVRAHNLAIAPAGGGDPVLQTTAGTATDPYEGPFQWSPDSRHLVAWRAHIPETRQIHMVQSSPPDRVEPRLLSIDYAKPGDPIRQRFPVLFDPAARSETVPGRTLFQNPWSITEAAWAPDSTAFTFLYNQRGHQVMRLVALGATDGEARETIGEKSDTFIDYSQKTWLHRLEKFGELLWMSERSGFNHIYRIRLSDGAVINPVTSGPWNVLGVVAVEEGRSRLLLKINGQPGSDPYYEHFAWVNFDGSGFTRLTQGDGTHRIELSPCGRWICDTWSRTDQPPVTEIRKATDGSLVAELSRGDDGAMQRAGWQRPERFAAKGRDGKTEIHGVIYRPPGFDPAKKYPVVEYIYAGPHGYFTPKSFSVSGIHTDMAAHGFVVVQCDGMGTNWRGKAFHDVCWKNLMDAGIPDHIAWLRAAAATRPWMDLSRVGIFGGSAGGQNALAAILRHGDFYRAAAADCGCHDNRMDKIWWNEAWMGWPVDESYARNSNVTHAAELRGALLLTVGELDTNVDPASTMQVVAALERAGKTFDFVPIANSDHGAAETPYGRFRRAAFFVHELGGPE